MPCGLVRPGQVEDWNALRRTALDVLTGVVKEFDYSDMNGGAAYGPFLWMTIGLVRRNRVRRDWYTEPGMAVVVSPDEDADLLL